MCTCGVQASGLGAEARITIRVNHVLHGLRYVRSASPKVANAFEFAVAESLMKLAAIEIIRALLAAADDGCRRLGFSVTRKAGGGG